MTSPVTVERPNILQRINAVRKTFGYVQKDQKKIDGQYTATRYDDVVEKLHPLLVEHGIVFATEAEPGWEVVATEQKTSKGAIYTRFQGIFRTTFYNVDDPKDFIVSSAPGFGLDQGDKGAGKAHTYATKSNLLKTFSIVCGDEEEKRAETTGTDQSKPGITSQERDAFIKAIDESDSEADIQAVLKAAKKQIAGVAGEYKGHPDYVPIFDAASKRVGALRETKKA